MGKTVAIIGSGLAGAITAFGLKKQGFEVTLYDRVDPIENLKETLRSGVPQPIEFGDHGGGIGVLGNGMTALKNLGLLEHVEHLRDIYAVTEQNLMLIDGSDRVVRKMNHQEPPIYQLRYRIHQAIVKAATGAGIKLFGAKKIKNLTQTDDKVTVTFEDGSTVVSDFVVGADGVHSKTRKLLFPDSPDPEIKGTGQITLFDLGRRPDGSVVEFNHLPGVYSNPLTAISMFTGRVSENEGEVKIFQLDAFKPTDADDDWRPVSDLPKESSKLADQLESWGTHPSIVNCVRHARRISPVNLYDLPDLPSFHKGRVVLVGDAAHGMLPFMAQGLCQSIEDAGVLCDLLGHYQDTDYKTAFAKYDEIRVPRAHLVAGESRATYNRLKASNGFQMKFGRFMMRIVFSILNFLGKMDDISLHDYRDDVVKAVPEIQFS
ncbi:FAD/NAD(P)-binding domain-containing protein [Rhizoclosmatium globosum]|uniref:FAD/NAD(P)-binding domain-containing protein n=1 Tax=Rhizoclosmatium globosum TaxID=329046 RepID=A0A1Y2B8W2_9FUNG|nr:FAD/NAD(P)-binding domain-containing protein [Rhizoclosmatium globosum]|eukprot:ORY31136.1 FAD/NAD(P)-binding domain-containing protein [Rhizoclosmatium globosum]